MSELEDLPSWAGRSTDDQQTESQGVGGAHQRQPEPVEPPEPRRRPITIALLALFGIVALLGMGAVGYLLAASDSSSETATAGDSSADGASDAAGRGQLGSEEVATTGDDETATAGDGAAGETAAGSADGTAAEDTVTVDVDETGDSAATDGSGTDDGESSDSGRQAFFRGGKVYLTGAVPSEEVGKLIEQKAAAVVGPDNVVNEYVIDPTVTIEPGASAPLYVEDVVLFAFNSVAIAEPFLPILDLGTLLLRQNPQASVTVITRTDAVGTEAVNLEVARRRAQAVIDYWLSKGVDADQITADPRGEELASDDDDAETRALNRRAEFIITGLLD